MGYRTNYSLYVYDHNFEVVDESLAIIEKIEDLYTISLDSGFGCKWDDHIKDMIEFSKKYPNYYFYFSNKGDEQDDIWVSFFYNGRYSQKELQPEYPSINQMICILKK